MQEKLREIGGIINILIEKFSCGLSKIISVFRLNLANNVDQKECFYWKVYVFSVLFGIFLSKTFCVLQLLFRTM